MEQRCLLSAALPNGTANAMAYDASGKLWMAYFDTADKDLKYAVRDTNGTWSAPQVIDEGLKGAANEDTPASDAQVGEYVTMVIERGGTPGVAYFDAYWSNLKYAHFNAATQQWDVQHVDSAGRVGTYPSISYSAGGAVAISYFSASAGQLRLTQLNSTGWGGSTTPSALYDVVDGSATTVAGRFSVLAYNPGWGRWAIGYDDSANGAAKYAYQKSGNVWQTRTVDAAPTSDVAFTSIAFDSSNRPALAYYDTAEADLKFARGADVNAATWTVVTPASKNTAGKYANMFYDAATDKFTIYYNLEAGSTTKINYVTGNAGISWSDAQTLYTGGGSEDHVLNTPGVAGGLTYSWSALNAAGQQTLYVNDTTTGTAWRQDQADAGMLGRVKYAGYAVYSVGGVSKIFVVGGDVDDGSLGATGYYSLSNLIRASTDGGVTWSTWTPQGPGGTAAFGARTRHVTVSFQGKLWVIGGLDGGGYKRDVWSSPDGVTWTQGADMPAAFGDRGAVAATVSTDGSTLYLIGGELPGAGGAADVWSTTDGVTWTQRTSTAPFGARGRASALYFNNRLWLLGGDLFSGGGDFYQDDAWWSADGGVTWTQATAASGAARFSARAGQTAAVYDNRMWVLGGQAYTGGTVFDYNDAYYSFDGINWIPAATGEAFQRNGAGTVVFGGRLITMFGENMSMKNDVWSTT
jgi:hypothetical protein